ncbi:DNA internalization-related competence protein ComEC/Rec2 [Photobacterium swingsii]|uniref:DNA internalization-related competence protein ComEC/Rec2 n=2 Tax=Photobacterium swingsii TaxID=680026 RepID=A0A2T3PCL1_9GAMM|nr:DNA internalization-related competence protein ComEC/Rec2 [Photobacterium swingsii]PSW26942.1 DNA internalization-related competence protein ComEC/Rec2 [Photobacterium swingsii]
MVIQAAVGFSIGLLSLHYWSYVPATHELTIITLLGGGVALFLRYYLCHYALANVLIWALAGGLFVYISTSNYIYTVKQIPPMGANITIVGIVDSIQNVNIPSDNFDFIIKEWRGQPETSIREMKVRFYWDKANTLKQGEVLQLQAMLRRPYGRVNQAGYDAEKWYVGHGFHGRGHLLSVIPAASSALQGTVSIRQRFFDTVVEQVIDSQHHGLLLALSFGVKDALTADDWLWLRDSGLAHLMAISGLHIGLAVALGWWGGLRLRGALPEAPNLTWLPMWLGLLVALSYAWLAGFSVPTQRALLMACIVMLFTRLLILSPGWFILLLTFVLCLAIDPLASYTMGFWLSFSAVFVLLLLRVSRHDMGEQYAISSQQEEALNTPSKQRGPSSLATMLSSGVNAITCILLRVYRGAKQLLVLQLYLLALMLPLQWYFFGGFSAFAPVVNFIALPLVSFITVPLIFAALLFMKWPELASFFWWLADFSLQPVAWLGKSSVGAWFEFSAQWLPLVVIFAGGIFSQRVLPFRFFPALYLSIFVVFCSWQWRQHLPFFNTLLQQTLTFDGTVSTHSSSMAMKSGVTSLDASGVLEWRVDMLDVGHGLAVIITRNGRAVLYDTGNRWLQGSIASSVVEPVLKDKGMYHLDGLILSHADSDHAGGSHYMVDRFSPSWKRSSDNRAGYLPCVKGESWQWQSLSFTVIWPPKRVKRAANPHSCVITISDKLLARQYGFQATEVLLTGDIDAISELLIARAYPQLSPDVFFVPHHGSKTSSSVTWLERITPQLALVSVGRYNPWQLPAPSVKARYLQRDIPWLSTAELGQVSVVIGQGEVQYQAARTNFRQAWYRDAFSAL